MSWQPSKFDWVAEETWSIGSIRSWWVGNLQSLAELQIKLVQLVAWDGDLKFVYRRNSTRMKFEHLTENSSTKIKANQLLQLKVNTFTEKNVWHQVQSDTSHKPRWSSFFFKTTRSALSASKKEETVFAIGCCTTRNTKEHLFFEPLKKKKLNLLPANYRLKLEAI